MELLGQPDKHILPTEINSRQESGRGSRKNTRKYVFGSFCFFLLRSCVADVLPFAEYLLKVATK